MRKPKNAGLSAQHEKTWIFDQQMFLLTSMSATRNYSSECEEAGLFVKAELEVQKSTEDFERLVSTSEVIPEKCFIPKVKTRNSTSRAPSKEIVVVDETTPPVHETTPQDSSLLLRMNAWQSRAVMSRRCICDRFTGRR